MKKNENSRLTSTQFTGVREGIMAHVQDTILSSRCKVPINVSFNDGRAEIRKFW